MSQELPTVAFIGVGTMMEAMVDKAIDGGWPRQRLLLTHRRPERREELAKRFGASVSGENFETVGKADMLILGVRPQEMEGVIGDLQPAFRAGQTLISIAAGLTVEWLQARLPAGMTIVRVTPPPTAWVGAGVTLISGGEGLSDLAKAHIERLVKST
jgi:pyrroline-5-carboxylate reductase